MIRQNIELRRMKKIARQYIASDRIKENEKVEKNN